jgi:hypothetical protein
MSESNPFIQAELSTEQLKFMNLVESYLYIEPHSDRLQPYKYSTMYKNIEGNWPLPGDHIRFSLEVDETDEEVTIWRHAVEFLGPSAVAETLASAEHCLKRIEGGQARVFTTQSRIIVQNFLQPAKIAGQAQVSSELEELTKHIQSFEGSLEKVPKTDDRIVRSGEQKT